MSTTATTTTVMRPAPSSSTSTTVLESLTRQQQQTLTLRLNRPKKKVSWKEDTVDNEYMQKKSSKICCIFHKEKPFDEDDSDDDDDCNHDHKSDDNDEAFDVSYSFNVAEVQGTDLMGWDGGIGEDCYLEHLYALQEESSSKAKPNSQFELLWVEMKLGPFLVVSENQLSFQLKCSADFQMHHSNAATNRP
ncbi:hypothetical protein DKX38_007351 [Salix brachista]|uniref:Uncharacterized protein n=1 Tax=Salix brachista TaxID=2182728 RepID=A0A5N5MN14_9ROSI|nr:hypothetical protein DKX38_007351 [Salix brachista]